MYYRTYRGSITKFGKILLITKSITSTKRLIEDNFRFFDISNRSCSGDPARMSENSHGSCKSRLHRPG